MAQGANCCFSYLLLNNITSQNSVALTNSNILFLSILCFDWTQMG